MVNLRGVKKHTYYPISLKEGKDPFLVPSDRFIAFLNLRKPNKRSVEKFCEDYQVFPCNMEEGLYKGFISEHAEIKKLAIKAMKGKLTSADIQNIEEALNSAKMTLLPVKKDQILKMNNALGRLPPKNISLDEKTTYYVRSWHYPTPMAYLYANLYEFILENQIVGKCDKCGNFFVKTRKWSKHCNNECKMGFNFATKPVKKRKKTT